MRWNCEEFVDPSKHRYYMKPIVNQEEDEAANNKSNNDDLQKCLVLLRIIEKHY